TTCHVGDGQAIRCARRRAPFGCARRFVGSLTRRLIGPVTRGPPIRPSGHIALTSEWNPWLESGRTTKRGIAVIILDNCSIYEAKCVQEWRASHRQANLYYLP
ncbi:MAG: hypothetical protein NUW23_14875, partial [Firmicutes bacterium]|nr:hypothetical protein [Bacillota bacterium]